MKTHLVSLDLMFGCNRTLVRLVSASYRRVPDFQNKRQSWIYRNWTLQDPRLWCFSEPWDQLLLSIM